MELLGTILLGVGMYVCATAGITAAFGAEVAVMVAFPVGVLCGTLALLIVDPR